MTVDFHLLRPNDVLLFGEVVLRSYQPPDLHFWHDEGVVHQPLFHSRFYLIREAPGLGIDKTAL